MGEWQMFWLEMNSIPDKAHCPHFRPSFSSLVGQSSPFFFLPLLFVPPPPVFPGHGNSQIYILDDGRRKHYFSAIGISLCIIQCRCPAFVTIVEWMGRRSNHF